MSTQVKAEVRSTKAVTRVRMRKKKPVISNTGKFFCFNNNVSNLYNNSVVEQIYYVSWRFWNFTIYSIKYKLQYNSTRMYTYNRIRKQANSLY
jgi:hypothetical protein